MVSDDQLGRYGTARLPGEPWMRWSFLLLLALAAILRFWDLAHLPYTHDELSALIRIYPSLSETIDKGVTELDTHPPGVQVFEWIWTGIFSKEEADVKLPFILMDLLAMFLLYRFALAWTGAGPALILTALMAALQYSVLYGQIARPYAAGLFTTALLADQLTRYVAFGHRRMLIGAGIAALLSAYTHHFALLLAALMGATGLILVTQAQRKAYMIMCAVVVVFYLPNIPIFFKQLGLGGLSEWLQAPDAGWLADYAWFIANDSVGLAALLILTVGTSAVLIIRNKGNGTASRWFLPVWGLLPLIIGFAYSVWRAPVLQYSVVLFSFPYLALFLLQGLRYLSQRSVLTLCGLTTMVAVHSLVQNRMHYDLFYRSKYEAMVRTGVETTDTYGKNGTLVLFDAPDNVIRFYYDLLGLRYEDYPYLQLRDGPSPGQVDSVLLAAQGRQVVYGLCNGSRAEIPALVQHRFPVLEKRYDLLDGQVFQLTAISNTNTRWHDRDTLAVLEPGGRSLGPWQVAAHVPLLRDSVGRGIAWDYSGLEFGISIDLGLDSLVMDVQDQVEIIAEVEGWNGTADAQVVADVRHADSTVCYRSGALDAMHRPAGRAVLTTSVSVTDIDPAHDLLMRAYVYNISKGPLRIIRMAVLRRAGNPVRYGTLAPLRWRGRYPPE